MISKNLLTYTTLQRLETISSTLLQCIQRTLDERTLGIIFRAEVLQKKKKKKIWWRRTRQISNSGEEKLEGFLSLPLTVFLYLQRSEKKRAHTPRWTQGMKVVGSESPTFLSRSFVNGIRGCDGLLESSERGGGLDGAGGLVDRDLKAFRCKHPLLLANSAT